MLLTDFIVASPDEAQAICDDLQHHEHWPCLQTKGLDNAVVGDLLAALGDDTEALAMTAGDRIIFQAGDEGPWIFQLPKSLTEKLSRLEDQQIPDIALLWVKGEASYNDEDAQGLETALRQLRNMARLAEHAKLSVLLWMSL